MQYRFMVMIETDEAGPEELEAAITDMLCHSIGYMV
jgi:hypothetical protein